MRLLIVFIFILFGSSKVSVAESSKVSFAESSKADFSSASYSYFPRNFNAYSSYDSLPVYQKEKLEQARQAVWKIVNGFKEGTAFFVSPNRIITNWHVIFDQKNMDSFLLKQKGNHRKYFIKRVVSISALHDLALLEVDGESKSYLSLRDSAVSDEAQLFLLGYPQGKFRYTLKTSSLKSVDDIFASFFIDYADHLSGNSGGPILDLNNELIGVLSMGQKRLAVMIKEDILRKFIDGDIGTSCDGWILNCIKEDMSKLKSLAKKGNQIAQYQLSKIYSDIGKNSLAFKWNHRSAEQGYVVAQYELGVRYYEGKGVKQNFPLAFEWLNRSAEQGDFLAQYELGMMYLNGEGVKQNFPLAFEWLNRSAEQGDPLAQYELGMMYLNGEGVKQNFPLAFEWFYRSAEQGYALSQYSLGIIYYYGEVVKQDFSLAESWFYRSAKQGHLHSQSHLAKMYYKGQGKKRNLFLALSWLGASAVQRINKCAKSFTEP